MSRLLICTTSDSVPVWVSERADEIGVRFVSLRRGTDETDDLHPGLRSLGDRLTDRVARRLARLRPDGYLLNGPLDYGPYLDGELIDAAGGLRLVTYLGQSLEPSEYATFLDIDALIRRGIPVTTTPGATESVAEGTIALLLALSLGVVPHNNARKAGSELPVSTRTGSYGGTLGIVGMGQIGRRVAELACSLGMNVIYTSRSRKPEVERTTGARFAGLPELFARAGAVSIHTPGSVTDRLIDDATLEHAGGIDLINTTSAPGIVEPQALLRALDDGRVWRVAIEGSYAEPYDRRLRQFGDDRVLLLPAYTSWDTERSWQAAWERYLRTLEALVSGGPLPYLLAVPQ